MVARYRSEGYGWAEISRIINLTFRTDRTPNQLKNNFNQRLYKQYPKARLEYEANKKSKSK
jgi:hypothetical protein